MIISNLKLMLNCSLETAVINVGNFDLGEQINNNTHKKGQVMLQKFRNIRVSHSSNQHYILLQFRFFPSKSPSHNQHTLHSSHTEVIVILFG